MARFAYPKYDLKNAIIVATKAMELGGSAKVSSLAQALTMDEKGGAFQMKISAAKSFGLIEGKNQVTVTELAKKILRPKEDGEKERAIKEALAFPPVFAKLLEKFSSSGARIPDASLLSNILHREYNVPDKTSKRVAVVFISSSQFAGGSNASTYNEQPEEENETPEEGKHTGIYIEIRGNNQHKIWIREDSDWDLVESIIKTMRKKKEGLDKV